MSEPAPILRVLLPLVALVLTTPLGAQEAGSDPRLTVAVSSHVGRGLSLESGLLGSGMDVFHGGWGIGVRVSASWFEREEFRRTGLWVSHPTESWEEVSVVAQRAFRPSPSQVLRVGVGVGRTTGNRIEGKGGFEIDGCGIFGCTGSDFRSVPAQFWAPVWELGWDLVVSRLIGEERWFVPTLSIGARFGREKSLGGVVLGVRIGGIPR